MIWLKNLRKVRYRTFQLRPNWPAARLAQNVETAALRHACALEHAELARGLGLEVLDAQLETADTRASIDLSPTPTLPDGDQPLVVLFTSSATLSRRCERVLERVLK